MLFSNDEYGRFEGKNLSKDIINATVSDDEVVASDVPRGTCFLNSRKICSTRIHFHPSRFRFVCIFPPFSSDTSYFSSHWGSSIFCPIKVFTLPNLLISVLTAWTQFLRCYMYTLLVSFNVWGYETVATYFEETGKFLLQILRYA